MTRLSDRVTEEAPPHDDPDFTRWRTQHAWENTHALVTRGHRSATGGRGQAEVYLKARDQRGRHAYPRAKVA